MPIWTIGIIITVPLAIAFCVRLLLEPRLVLSRPAFMQSRLQFKLDLGLYLVAALSMAFFNKFYYGFSLAASGWKLALGVAAIGLFASVDLALGRERTVLQRAGNAGLSLHRHSSLYPITRKFTILATLITILITVIILLVIMQDLWWLSQEMTPEKLTSLQTSVLVEILFVMGILLFLTVNLILSYARNLRLLFDNQTSALEEVRGGNLDVAVPVVTNDEFGVIAEHTNDMIEGLRDRLRMMEGLQVAREIQQTLIPQSPPELPMLDIACRSEFSDETGGDYYDFILADPDRMEVVVGDVTGHGIGAALLVATCRAFLRQRAQSGGSLASRLNDVNRMITRDNYGTGRTISLFQLGLDLGAMEYSWISAGHEPALLFDPAADSFTELGGGNIPLGIDEHWPYTEERASRPLGPGQLIVAGTDGIWETRSPSGDMFGMERFRRVIRETSQEAAETILEAIISEVDEFRDLGPQEDDITLVVIKGLGP